MARGENGSDGAKPRLIFLVTEDWYFWGHRLPQARAARDAGFAVGVATRVDEHGARIRAAGFELYPLGWRRGSVNPLGALAAIAEITSLYRKVRPAIVHHVSQKPILIGSIAARLAVIRHVVNAFTGLGFLFTAATFRARIIRAVLIGLLKTCSGNMTRYLAENPDDRKVLIERGIASESQITLIRGSGVDVEYYRPLPEPASGPVVIGCPTRMLRTKGIAETVEAVRIMRRRGSTAVLLLAGAPDPENPAAIPESELRAWNAEPGIEWVGHVDDVRDIWARSHIAVLASVREGLPMSLMEAAACGKPLVACDVPGCREVVRNGETGLLVPANDPPALAEALTRLEGDPALRARLGAGARNLVATELDGVTVGHKTIAVYRALMNEAV